LLDILIKDGYIFDARKEKRPSEVHEYHAAQKVFVEAGTM